MVSLGRRNDGRLWMQKGDYKPDEIIRNLREVEVLCGQGITVGEAYL